MSEEQKKDECPICSVIFILIIIIAILGGLYYDKYQDHNRLLERFDEVARANQEVKYLDGSLKGKCIQGYNDFSVISSLEFDGYHINTLKADRDVFNNKRIVIKGSLSIQQDIFGKIIACDLAQRAVLKRAILNEMESKQ